MKFTIYKDSKGRPAGCWPDDHPQKELLTDGGKLVPMYEFEAVSAEEALSFSRGFLEGFFVGREGKESEERRIDGEAKKERRS